MRQNKLFFIGTVTQITVFRETGLSPFIEMVFDFGISPEEAHTLYERYVDALVEMKPSAPSQLSVSFRSRVQRHERDAA